MKYAEAQMSKISLNTDNLLNPQTNKEPLRLEDLENKIINADCMDILKRKRRKNFNVSYLSDYTLEDCLQCLQKKK